jgi:hypothetical protein
MKKNMMDRMIIHYKRKVDEKMDKMLNDFVESIEFDFTTAIDTTELMNNKVEVSNGPERDAALSRHVDEIEQGIDDSMIAELLDLPDSMREIESLLEKDKQPLFSQALERDPALSRYVDELEKGIAASITAESLNLSQAIKETTEANHSIYRDRHFAQAMEDFEENMNLNDIKIFLPSAKTYKFARSIQQMEKGLVKIARQYMKKLAS